MADRTPQQFGGQPDGITDSTAAIQAAIDAWQPGDQVIISGGQFRTSAPLTVAVNDVVIGGDGEIRARPGFPAFSTLFTVTGNHVVFDGDGLELDQNDIMVSGDSIRLIGSIGARIHGLVSRGTQLAFLRIGSNTSDVVVEAIDHLGRGNGVLANDPFGVTQIVVRDCVFAHIGTGAPGNGVNVNCPTFGASDITVQGCIARGHIGEASNNGIGFAFSNVQQARVYGCLAERCESDGFHWERQSDDGEAFDCRALHCGVAAPAGGNGSGFIVYDSSRWLGEALLAQDCQYHGIALSGQGSLAPRADSVIYRCSALDSGRDGFHFTAQIGGRIDYCHARDPSRNLPHTYAGFHLARQGGTPFENRDCFGDNNTVELTGATLPLGATVVRADSINCTLNGISGSAEIRITEAGEMRLTENGELRILETA